MQPSFALPGIHSLTSHSLLHLSLDPETLTGPETDHGGIDLGLKALTAQQGADVGPEGSAQPGPLCHLLVAPGTSWPVAA